MVDDTGDAYGSGEYSQSSDKEWPSVKWPIQVVEIMYLDRWKVRARKERSKDYSEELHSDEQSADRNYHSQLLALYQRDKAAASASSGTSRV